MKIYSIDDWKKYFPYDEPREQQIITINAILDAFYNQEKRIFIGDLSTGIGKSAIGVTITRYMIDHPIVNKPDDTTEYKRGAYTLTTQKILQEQYMRDFGEPKGNMVNIKSSSNYTCNFFCHQSCAESRLMLKYEPKGTKFFKACVKNCVYMKAKAKFLNSNESITNYSYFLAEHVYAGNIKPRELLILDECHNITDELSSFIDILFSERFANSLGIHMPHINTDLQAINWVKKEYIPNLQLFIVKLESVIEQLKEEFDNTQDNRIEIELSKQTKKLEKLDKHLCKSNRFVEFYTRDNWVLNIVPAQDKSSRKLEFKPIDVSPYANDLLFRFGKNLILMSATVINNEAFCEPLGIDTKDVAYLSLPSPFPFDNRPVFYAPTGKMGIEHIDKTLPKMAETVNMLLEHHKNDKGLIHCISGDANVAIDSSTTKKLKDISIGDKILSYNIDYELFEQKTVTNVFDMGIKHTITIELENGRMIRCTPEHMFLTRNRDWIEAQHLTSDDNLVDFIENEEVKNLKIKSIAKSNECQVYDISVEDNHNFIVENVVVHNCHSYKVANYIKKNIKSSRLLIHDANDRDKILEKHLTSSNATVLLSPSMTEGIDLYGDLARFQIICKTPFPYLGDKIVKKRMYKWKWWYPYQTIKTIIQSIGRSVRNNEDYCTTYILDENFEYFHVKNKHLFPEWFSKVLHK